MIKKVKAAPMGETARLNGERHFPLNPNLFEVIYNEHGFQTLVMKDVEIELIDEQPLNEDFKQWLDDRGIMQGAILDAVFAEVEQQQVVKLLAERLLDR